MIKNALEKYIFGLNVFAGSSKYKADLRATG